jgi:hypothetical protein
VVKSHGGERLGKVTAVTVAGVAQRDERKRTIDEVSKDLVYSYVKAVILTETHTLQVYLNDQLVQTFEYHLTAPNQPKNH